MNWENSISQKMNINNEISNIEQKQKIANIIAKRVKDGDVVGAGSGSTAAIALQEIGRRIKEENIFVTIIPTSFEIEMLCTSLGIVTTTLINRRPDWAFDGADEVDPNNNLIKGRGGALFKEKIVLSSSKENYILADDSKMVSKLGEKFLLPVEIFPYAVNLVQTNLKNLGAVDMFLRTGKGKDGPIITESGNFILDVKFEKIEEQLEKELKDIVGVVESGLFIGRNYNISIVKG